MIAYAAVAQAALAKRVLPARDAKTLSLHAHRAVASVGQLALAAARGRAAGGVVDAGDTGTEVCSKGGGVSAEW